MTPEEISQLVRRSRAVALLLGALTFALMVTIRSSGVGWLTAGPWYVGLGLFTGAIVVVFGAVPLVHLAVFWRRCRPPRPGFALGRWRAEPAFAAPVTPLLSGWLFASQAGVIGLILPVGTSWSGAGSDPALQAMRLVLVVLAVLALGAHVWALFRPPHLRLTASGLVVNAPLPWGRLIPWDAFAPGGPTGHEARRGVLWLQARPGTPGLGAPHPTDLYGRPPQPGYFWYRLKLSGTLVDPEFLARALRTYRKDPSRRAAIGTRAELLLLAGPSELGVGAVVDLAH
ncbi:hypothetical protein [Cryptosporangium phraense]|uniref:Uncharacterized protein n=1 Tax=Cryptosporangium phraense TaxID=2593070 RepID=A0A545AZI8_9ACTN|nr:hypothetical protein [Cryptosporangium phraense]TQS46025.1 hypothetical protein FL583_05920 [Cryptosporangium phraense]